MKRAVILMLTLGGVCAFAAATANAGEDSGCAEISSDARFVDLDGNAIQLASVGGDAK